MKNDPPLATATTLTPRWSGLALRPFPLAGLLRVSPILVGALGAAGMFVLLPPSAHLRLWACLAGASAFLHVASAVSASGLRPPVLLLAAGAQFLLAVRGSELGPAWIGSAFALGALVTADGSRSGASSLETLVGRAWVALQVTSAALVWSWFG